MWFDTVFSGPYLAFSIGVLPCYLHLFDVKTTPAFGKKVEVWLNVFF